MVLLLKQKYWKLETSYFWFCSQLNFLFLATSGDAIVFHTTVCHLVAYTSYSENFWERHCTELGLPDTYRKSHWASYILLKWS